MSPTSENEDTNLELSLGMPLGSPNNITTMKSHCARSTGMPPTNVLCFGPELRRWPAGLGTGRWLEDMSFVHPWSLAARQEKVVLEQMRILMASGGGCSSPTETRVVSMHSQPLDQVKRVHQIAPLIGWPPVRSHRKNILSSQASKPSNEDDKGEEKEAKKSKWSVSESIPDKKEEEKKPTKFVKVNIEGFAVGRKIDLMAHEGYDSLSCTLHCMFNNFLSVSNHGKERRNEHEGPKLKMTFLYEDNEGDRMLIGDVPWEMFIESARRLYISCHLKVDNHDAEVEAEKKRIEQSQCLINVG